MDIYENERILVENIRFLHKNHMKWHKIIKNRKIC